MRLADILSLDRVSVSLEAEDKVAALRAIARLFAKTETTLGEDDVLRVLQAREQLASTGVGSGVAIPHGRIGAVDKMLGALAISRRGVSFESIDGEPARIFMAVLAPERHTGDHLKALARISRLLRDGAVRQRLLAAADEAQALQIVVEEDARH